MPRFKDYWAKRAAGLCVECPNPSSRVRCLKCRLRRQSLRARAKGGDIRGSRELDIAEEMRPSGERITPALAADDAIAPLKPAQRQALIDCFHRRYLHADDVDAETLLVFRRGGLVYRERIDDSGDYVPDMYVPSPLGKWAAGRLIAGVNTR